MFSAKDKIITVAIVVAVAVAYGIYTDMSQKSILIFILIALIAEFGIDILLKSLRKEYKDEDKENESPM